tara:strand:+ start:131 stop:652 length:522 start_codon:yes stop_codon:yes gene_type:complete
MDLNNKEDLLKKTLNIYFNDDNKKKLLIDILSNKYNISLRIIDWFVTNYCKKNNICWEINNTRFVVYLNYKLQLKAYSKKYFDPFCRRDRIYFHYDNTNNFLITTVGQLNFIKWMIDNNIINYIIKYYKLIEDDMHSTIKKKKLKYKNKRTELSQSATKTINKNEVNIILKFE